jgi:hypothetical protein
MTALGVIRSLLMCPLAGLFILVYFGCFAFAGCLAGLIYGRTENSPLEYPGIESG